MIQYKEKHKITQGKRCENKKIQEQKLPWHKALNKLSKTHWKTLFTTLKKTVCFRGNKHLSLMGFWCLFVSKKMPNNVVMWYAQQYSLYWPLTSTMSTVEQWGITALFAIFLETNKHYLLTSCALGISLFVH